VVALQALALTPALGGAADNGTDDGSDLSTAHALTRALRASHPEWRGMLLTTPAGQVVFSSEAALGLPARAVVDAAGHAEVVRTRAPVVGQLAQGPSGNQAFAVRVPVMREGALRYVLSAVVQPDAVANVLARQKVPPGWVVSVFDANRRRVARSGGKDHNTTPSQQPSPTLSALLDRLGAAEDEIAGRTQSADDIPVQAAVVRLKAAPWTLVTGAATSLINEPLKRTLLIFGSGLLFSLLLSGLAAWWMARAITRPMARLREVAVALGRNLPVGFQKSGITEVDSAAAALFRAAADRERHEKEREQLLGAERLARTKAEGAEHQLARLVQAGTLLSRSLQQDSTLEAIAAVVVPEFADICRIDLLDNDGVLQRKLTRHFDPARSEEISRMVDSRSAPSVARGSFPWAIATGEVFVMNLTESRLDELEDPGLRAFAQALQLSAGCVVPLVARGRTIGAMGILQAESGRSFGTDDIAVIGQLAQSVALALDNVRLLEQARMAQVQAEVASKAKDEFLAMLGHELRNPLAPIALALQLIERRDAGAFPRERQIIDRQVKHLSRMVDDLLDVSRIVSGKIGLKYASVDLRDVVRQALELTLPVMQPRGAPPVVSLPASPVMVRGEALRLTQILGNLLTNAAKFTDASRAIRITLDADETHARLEVADEGCGMPADLIPHVFEQFVQAKQQLQRAAGGLGLGLAIARSLTALHGGTIQAASPGPGLGSTFTVRLPLDRAELPAADAPLPRSSADGALSVLLVDDNQDALEMLAEWFRLEGCDVLLAASAEEVLPHFERRHIDAAVFDIGLPGMSGHELARRVRAGANGARLALIALSGYGQASDKRQAAEAGFDAHFAKPAPVDDMLREIRRLVRERASPAAEPA
ncbi:MAG: hybrid sensor histidine kinase/response regulator, partial [Comamonadaceae bacterium]